MSSRLKVKLDENLPESLVEIFTEHGHQAVTVPREGLAGLADESLFEVAKAEGRSSVLRAYVPMSP